MLTQLRVKVQTLNLWRFFKYFLSFPIHRRCFLKKMFLKFSQENTCVGVSFFSLKTCYFIKKRFQQRGFHVKFAKFLRTPILKNISERLLLKFMFCIKIKGLFTAWKVSKYGVISGPNFPVFSPNTWKYGPEITPYLDIFHAVILISLLYAK